MADEKRDVTGLVLVGIQALLFLAVAVLALVPGPGWWMSLVVGLVLVVLGSAGVVWAGRDLGRALTPMPTPNGAGLAARGIYRGVRHPMYASLIVICLGVAVGSGRMWSYVAVLVLALFFDLKTRYEERFLVGAYEGYAEYAARTGKFLPGVARRRLG